MTRLALLVAVLLAHTAYYIFPEGDVNRGWVAYISTHALLIMALMIMLPWASNAKSRYVAVIGGMACWLGILESAQAVGCSLIMWGTLSNADLCEQSFGIEVYVIAASLGVAWAIVGALRKRGNHG